MTQLLIVTTEPTRFADLKAELSAMGGNIRAAGSGAEALEAIAVTPVDLVIADEDLGDMQGLALIERLVVANPLINCALVSTLAPAAYHAASEGLGVLMQLPPCPSAVDGKRLMASLNRILGRTTAAD